MKKLLLFTRAKIIGFISVFLLTPFLLFSQPTEEEILESIDLGTVWLVEQQNDDGSWYTWGGEPWESMRVAYTGFALTKLCDRAYEHFYDSPFDPEYEYVDEVIDGFNFLFAHAKTDGPGTGIYFLEGSYDHHEIYNASVALMAFASSFTPDREINYPGNTLVDGLTFAQLVDEMIVYFEWAQSDDLPVSWEYGGWHYEPNDGGSDNSHTGYVVLGLRYAEVFGAIIPQNVKDELSIWIDYIQNDVNGDDNDGGSEYTNNWLWVNSLKTGNLLFEMHFIGDVLTDPSRANDALDYIERQWNVPGTGSIYDVGWDGHIQAMFCLMKGFESFDIETIEVGGVDRNWFEEFATYLLPAQQPTGYWNSGYWGDQLLNTIWALYVLEKVAPNAPPVANCTDIEVSADGDCFGYADAIDFDDSSYDPDWETGDALLTFTVEPSGPYGLGVTAVTLTVTDQDGGNGQCTATITVLDNTDPVITAITEPLTMWPPNHKYETFNINDFVTDVSDNCADGLTIDDVYFKSVSSDEPEDENGNGDGKTLNDMVIADDCKSIQLRKERRGNHNGRYYTVYLGLDDEKGNSSEVICHVTVQHNPDNPAINDDAVYWVCGLCDDSDNCTKSAIAVATGFELTNYPNPFEGTTTVSFSVNEPSNVILKVYNAQGIEVSTLFDAHAKAGLEYKTDFFADNLPKGIYFTVLQSEGRILGTNKMLFIK